MGPPKDGEVLGMPRMWAPIHPKSTAAFGADQHAAASATPPASVLQAGHGASHDGHAEHATLITPQVDAAMMKVDASNAAATSMPEPGRSDPSAAPTVLPLQTSMGALDVHSSSAASAGRLAAPASAIATLQHDQPSSAHEPGWAKSFQPGPDRITEGRAGGASMQSTIQRPPVTQPVQQTLPGLEVHAPAPVWGVDSSDSEGPMPEIDSGSDMDASAETSDDDL